jgi:raffinose/stachyose/melibiose transport system permease protein
MNSTKARRTFFEFASFTLPAFIAVLIVFIIPFVMNLYYSLTMWNGVSRTIKFVGLNNFVSLFKQDPQFWESGLFTIKYAVIFVILVNIIAMAMAIILNQKIKATNIYRTIFFIPNSISMVIVGFLWSFIFTGGFSSLYNLTGIKFFNLPWLGDPSYAFYSIIFVSIWQSLGFYMLIYLAGLQGIPIEIMDACQIDGAGFFDQVFRIIIPLLAPTISICVFLSLANAFKVFDVILTLTHGGPGSSTSSFSINIYQEAFIFSKYGYGIAKSVIFFVMILIVSIVQRWLFNRKETEY